MLIEKKQNSYRNTSTNLDVDFKFFLFFNSKAYQGS